MSFFSSFCRPHRALPLVLLVTLHSLWGCSGNTITNDSPAEDQYTEGERLLRKERYLEAIERFRVIRSRYPYSKFAALASLRIADAHYNEESFVEAGGAYKTFRELYPKHEQAGFALFRIGESNFNMLPGTIDRDLEPATAAIEAFKEYIRLYPNTPDSKQAQARISDLQKRLAEKEDYIGNFYYVRDNFASAASRYKNLLDQYPGRGFDERALFRLAYSYDKLGEYTKAEEAIGQLEKDFPNGTYAKDALALKTKIQGMKK